MQAASVDTVHAYGADGDLHWTYETIKEWWTGPRREIEQKVRQLLEAQLALGTKQNPMYSNGLWRWMTYLQEGLYQNLQVYAFFLESRRPPVEGDTLPDV